MLDRWQKRLVLTNVAVFVAVLSIFCGIVYYLSCSAIDNQLRGKIETIADGAISSIDFDREASGVPDLIVSVLPGEASPSLENMRIQWFSPEGKLKIEKG